MRTEVRSVTPAVAKEMLRRNTKNRGVNVAHVRFLKEQMNSGQWLFDGQPIRFSESGSLLDGQHRLNAIVESETTQQFLIVSGVDSNAFKVMDTGKSRDGADCLSINGVSYSKEIAQIAKMTTKLKKGKHIESGYYKMSNTDILNWYNDNEHVIEMIRKSEGLNTSFSRVLSKAFIAGMMYLFAEKNATEAEIFMSKLCNGLDLTTDSPIYIVRKKLIEDRINQAKLPVQDKVAIIFKAWNLYRLGKSCKQIRYNKDNEKFPVII